MSDGISIDLFPRVRLQELLDTLDPGDPAWISLVTRADLDKQLAAAEERLAAAGGAEEKLPLYGVPFAVKDNIDVAGMVTTAACPAYAYTAREDSPSVANLKAAGAILMGKTNLDQFATGLTGTRSPYGTVPNTFQPARICGGSSSGSASVVARGLVAFALGTDTAGSGRVPAAFNNIVGLKPTRGSISTRGVVPACRTLDCVSVFALTVGDAEIVYNIAKGYDRKEPYSREAVESKLVSQFKGAPVLAIPAEPKWYGDHLGEAAFDETLEKMKELGAIIRPIDFTPMHQLAGMLYAGPWVAERLAVAEQFLEFHPDEINPVVREIIKRGFKFDAVDFFKAEYRRMELVRTIHEVFDHCDALLVPTAPTFPTIAEVNADPVETNNRLGTYSNFVNLADLCALALPACFRDDGLPFGISLIAPAWHDAALSDFGKLWTASLRFPPGSPALHESLAI